MGSAYTILGRSVPSYQLALGTIVTSLLFVLPNPFKKAESKPLWTASSEDEEKFIKEYLTKHAEKH